MTEEENLKIVQTIVQNYEEGKALTPSEEYLAKDIEWIVSGSIDDPLTGRYVGIEQVEQLFAIFNHIVDGGRHETKEYIVQGDKVVVCGEERIQFKNNGRNVQSSFVYVITLREGKIVQWRVIYGYP
ncbi:nuclear transport factor 2 family protein [Planktothrix sp. FACHB-1355]|uniref:Nuclear transport factor 2 family protein n=1 Tax=Aerosakkonema funiforme FACHB-1375 TaxID=2949571 RepID=A0A926VDF4_9CYAN|nr:nuclear transport factor 2 family protein [Aerosakkonema funiforme]MBD2181766.1 nuclear transport factor 2 family protein [Aerosakkonema funiforme FACHB-1375]MBD3561263.1 nuclear transport factor 2 family protein [Planktothrix sp. FACHB-1355]